MSDTKMTKDEDAEKARYEFTEWMDCIAGNYAQFVLTPRILSDRRRRNGDRSASPRDYACLCSVKGPDGIPDCRERRPQCRFAPLKRPPGDANGCVTEWRRIHVAERERIIASLPRDLKALLPEVLRMRAELEKANARRLRDIGEPLPLAVTAWSA